MRCATAIDVHAPLARVWDVFTDIPRAPERVSGIERVEVLTPGPFVQGFRWRETRIMFKREATEELAVSSCEPRRSYSVVCDSCGCRWTTTFAFEPQGEAATRVEQTTVVKPLTLGAKLMAPLGWLMLGTLRRRLTHDLRELAQACAASAAQAAVR